MTVQVTGVLKGPTQKLAPRIKVRITSQGNQGDVLKGAPAYETTGSDASYNFPLVDGVHSVEVLYSGAYKEGGIVTIDADTPSVLSLPELFALAV